MAKQPPTTFSPRSPARAPVLSLAPARRPRWLPLPFALSLDCRCHPRRHLQQRPPIRTVRRRLLPQPHLLRPIVTPSSILERTFTRSGSIIKDRFSFKGTTRMVTGVLSGGKQEGLSGLPIPTRPATLLPTT